MFKCTICGEEIRPTATPYPVCWRCDKKAIDRPVAPPSPRPGVFSEYQWDSMRSQND